MSEFVFHGTPYRDSDESASGVCGVSMDRDRRDRRYWTAIPFGDNARDGGVFPIVKCVVDDFGNLYPVQRS